jgi:transcriptional regulator with GAF, ATPase, and Fis domain
METNGMIIDPGPTNADGSMAVREPRHLPSLSEVEREHVIRVLSEVGWRQARASRILGITRWSLSRRLRKYGIDLPNAGTRRCPGPMRSS